MASERLERSQLKATDNWLRILGKKRLCYFCHSVFFCSGECKEEPYFCLCRRCTQMAYVTSIESSTGFEELTEKYRKRLMRCFYVDKH